MKNLVLDCSMAMCWCFEDEVSAAADKILDNISAYQLIVPVLWWYEVCNVLTMAERKNRIKPHQSKAFLNTLKTYPFIIDTAQPKDRIAQVMSLAKKHKFTFYDSSYLELAKENRALLATHDSALIKACRVEGVEVFE